MCGSTEAVCAAGLLRIGETRKKLFGSQIFQPSAWEIMLFLQAENRPRPAKAICDALDMFEPTTRRWLAVLEKEGLITQGRNKEICLTDRAREDMQQALAA